VEHFTLQIRGVRVWTSQVGGTWAAYAQPISMESDPLGLKLGSAYALAAHVCTSAVAGGWLQLPRVEWLGAPSTPTLRIAAETEPEAATGALILERGCRMFGLAVVRENPWTMPTVVLKVAGAKKRAKWWP